MPNVGPDIPSLLGELAIVPPPTVGRFGRLKRLARKAGRVAKKAGKTAVKIHTAPIKVAAKAGKAALMKAAQLAATPVKLMFKRLAMRRAKYLSWTARKSLAPTATEKVQAVSWALNALAKKGPLGKFGVRILKFTRSATLGRHVPASDVGLTGAEIAAAAASIAAAIGAIMKALDRPGEAPADPTATEPSEGAEQAAEAVDAATEGRGDDDDEKRGVFKRVNDFVKSGPAVVPPPGATGYWLRKKKKIPTRARGRLAFGGKSPSKRLHRF